MSDIMLPRRFNLTAILGVVLFIFVIVYINTAVRWPEPQPQETLNHAKNLPQAHNKVQLTKDEEPKMPPAKEFEGEAPEVEEGGAVDSGEPKVVQMLREFIDNEQLSVAHKPDETKWKLHLPEPPFSDLEKHLDTKHTYLWDINTNHGKLTLTLKPAWAPKHVINTMYLSMLGYYDNTIMHRVIPGFMAQFGCPLGTGTGGPGYQYGGEFGLDPAAKHSKRGMLSTANAGPFTDGSQVFVTFVETSYLNGKHTVFGELSDGEDVLQQLEKLGSPSGTPTEPLNIESSKIRVEL